MNRRDLLKKAGLGSAALAAIPAIGNGLATVALADGAEGFHFVCVSVASATEILAMQGDGRFNGEEAEGGGRFVHFHGSTVISGSWKAGKVRSFVDAADFDPNGQFSGGTLDLDIQLRPIGLPRVNARLLIQCNPPGVEEPEEGITVTVPSPANLTFEPFRGLTILTPHSRD
jgi:hypothetical protein